MELLIIILILIFVIVIPNVKVVPQAKVYVIERLGSYYKTWHNGLQLKIPFLDRIANIVTLKEVVKDLKRLDSLKVNLIDIKNDILYETNK